MLRIYIYFPTSVSPLRDLLHVSSDSRIETSRRMLKKKEKRKRIFSSSRRRCSVPKICPDRISQFSKAVTVFFFFFFSSRKVIEYRCSIKKLLFFFLFFWYSLLHVHVTRKRLTSFEGDAPSSIKLYLLYELTQLSPFSQLINSHQFYKMGKAPSPFPSLFFFEPPFATSTRSLSSASYLNKDPILCTFKRQRRVKTCRNPSWYYLLWG